MTTPRDQILDEMRTVLVVDVGEEWTVTKLARLLDDLQSLAEVVRRFEKGAGLEAEMLELEFVEIHSPGSVGLSASAGVARQIRLLLETILFLVPRWRQEQARAELAHAQASIANEQARFARLRNDTLEAINGELRSVLPAIPEVPPDAPWRQSEVLKLVQPIVMRLIGDVDAGEIRGVREQAAPQKPDRKRRKS